MVQHNRVSFTGANYYALIVQYSWINVLLLIAECNLTGTRKLHECSPDTLKSNCSFSQYL